MLISIAVSKRNFFFFSYFRAYVCSIYFANILWFLAEWKKINFFPHLSQVLLLQDFCLHNFGHYFNIHIISVFALNNNFCPKWNFDYEQFFGWVLIEDLGVFGRDLAFWWWPFFKNSWKNGLFGNLSLVNSQRSPFLIFEMNNTKDIMLL